MAPEPAVSFRILHPDPWDLRRVLPLSPEVTCRIEFSSTLPVRKLQAILQGLIPNPRHLQFHKGKPWHLDWTMPWEQAVRLPKSLSGFPFLSIQVQKGLAGYSSDGFWKLKGRKGRIYHGGHRTQIMGILNVTPDSFSDGGLYLDPSAAVDQASRMQEEGADWIDVGAESTRPGAQGVSASEEKRRLLPVLKALAKSIKIPISVDTYKAEVAKAAVLEGAQMVNDIGALRLDPRMGKTLSALKVPVVLMHMRGQPRTMQKNPVYQDVVGEILTFFRERMDYALNCGIPAERLLLDPGFGFGKSPWHNIELTRRLWEFKVLGRPLLLGPSRKSTLGHLLNGAPAEKRVEATGAAVTVAILKGADFVRVHDVQSMAPVVKIADAIRYDRGLDRP